MLLLESLAAIVCQDLVTKSCRKNVLTVNSKVMSSKFFTSISIILFLQNVYGQRFDCALASCANVTLTCESEPADPCEIFCTSDGACLGKEMTCNADRQCDITCSGPNSCSIGTNAFNPNDTITPMTCPSNENCQINCIGDRSCIAANITCPNSDGFECNILCSGTGSCQDLIVNAKQSAGAVYVNCTGDVSCNNIISLCDPANPDCVSIISMFSG